MATREAPPVDSTATGEQEESRETAVFVQNLGRMSSLLSTEYVTVASRALSAGLIDIGLASEVMNSEPLSMQKRGFALLLAIEKNFNSVPPEEAEERMATLIKVLQKDLVMASIVQKLSDDVAINKRVGRKNPERRAFLKNIDSLNGMIQHSVLDIATGAFASGLIGEQVHHQVTSITGNHSSVFIGELLNAVLKKIKEEPEELDTFIEEVLQKMAPFTDTLIANLRDQLSSADSDMDA